jgi:hypothetical protein
MEVKIVQDIHYTHNRQLEPVFVIKVYKRDDFNSSMDCTVPELIAIRDEIEAFLLNQAKEV